MSDAKLTQEELLEQMERCWHLYSLPESKKNQQAYNQLREIVREYFRQKRCITLDLDNLCMDKKTCNYLKETGITVVESLVEQQNARPKVSRENIKRFAMTKLEDEHHYEENAEAIACWLNALGWEVVEE